MYDNCSETEESSVDFNNKDFHVSDSIFMFIGILKANILVLVYYYVNSRQQASDE